jgi:hypothetical protein
LHAQPPVVAKEESGGYDLIFRFTGIEWYRPKALTEPFGSVVVHRFGLDYCGQLVGFKEAK